MDPTLRSLFNAQFSAELYERMSALMRERMDEPEYGFRLAETPLFVPADLRGRCERAAYEILDQLRRPEVIAAGERAVPERYRVPRRDAVPHVATIDFAIARAADGSLEPRLIELQAFASLYGMELLQAEIWGEMLASMPGMPKRWTPLFGGIDRGAYVDLLRRTIVADAEPDEVVLLDLEPERQKTRADFHAIRRLLGVRSVCLTEVRKDGRTLLAPKDGRLVPVRRVFNRCVFDEIERRAPKIAFAWGDDLDVAWVAHPDWYWIWSKASLPLLDHPAAPRTRRLSELAELPRDLSNHVLKPLFSFAGTGVDPDPTPERLASIAEADREHWILQEKVPYAPALVAPGGIGVKAEIRMMFLRPEGERDLRLVINLVRLSRGKIHGVDHNKGLDWVGSSVGVWPA